jgi:hypothetical protein
MNGLIIAPIPRLRLFSALIVSLAIPLIIPIAGQASPAQNAIAQTAAPTAPPTDATQNPALQQKALDILDLARKEKFEEIRAYAAPELAKRVSAKDIKRIWENLLESTGPVEKVISSHVINTVNADLVVVNTQFKSKTGKFMFIFNPQGLFLGIDFPAVGTIDKTAKIVVQALADNDFVKARGYLSAFLKTEIFPQQVQDKWQRLLKSTGPFKRIDTITVVPGSEGNPTDVVLVTVEFAKITEDIFVIFDQDRRIVGIDVPEGVR